ncbi:phage tail protein [Nocardia sp. NPDC052566]|uniref:phage tail protein n=1 Tax=Nocardia sp. NPDC052566 TaxID=3364330 RepID=UPI0037C6E66C
MTMPADAIPAARFSIVVDGHEIASFSDLQGIVAEVEPFAYLEGSDKEVRYNQLPGRLKPPQVVLKRGMNGSMELWAWHESVRSGNMKAARRSCSLIMYNTDGKAVAKYWLERAWPAKVDISAMKAGASQIMYETVTLVCEYMQRIAP